MPEIRGNTDGIRKSFLEELQALYDYQVDGDLFLPPDLAETMAAYSARINREISLYISRGGEVLDVSIGYLDNVALEEIRLRRSQERLSMVRCVHTHPGGSAELSDVDLTALKTLWLDAMCAIGVDGQGRVTGVSAAFLGERVNGSPQPKVWPTVALEQMPQWEWLQQILHSDAEVLLGSDRLLNEKERAILVSTDSENSLDELAALAESAGADVVGKYLQIRSSPDPATYVGSGKAGELALEAQALEADLLIVDDELSSAQQGRLEEIVGLRVVDRTTLILDIFALNAVTSEGKLQVELAQLKYRSSHLKGQGVVLSRLLGGIGVRGPGESKLEMDRRHIRERMNQLSGELKKMERQRAVRRKGRDRNAVPVVALVGYTNAGKSSLLNRLSGADVLVKDQLFATLDAVNRRVELPDGDAFVLVDTVGFINKLPTDLIEAFHSTLEEATLADVLVIVSDASSPDLLAQRQVVETVLAKLEAQHQPRIEVLNKSDVAPPSAYQAIPGALHVSAVTGQGIDKLLSEIARQLRLREQPYLLLVPFSQYSMLNDLRSLGRVLSEEHRMDGTLVRAMLDKSAWGRLCSRYEDLKPLESQVEEEEEV
ncbi:MAG: GTPase HflX [Clostridiales bacterium]|nr:GTPase HflX [Clostridiales bacterium]